MVIISALCSSRIGQVDAFTNQCVLTLQIPVHLLDRIVSRSPICTKPDSYISVVASFKSHGLHIHSTDDSHNCCIVSKVQSPQCITSAQYSPLSVQRSMFLQLIKHAPVQWMSVMCACAYSECTHCQLVANSAGGEFAFSGSAGCGTVHTILCAEI